MPSKSNRYPLVVYEHILNRWWPTTLLIGLSSLTLGWLADRRPAFADEPERLPAVLIAGALMLIFTLFLILARRWAYVQAMPDHLRLVTPFLRLRISYQRILRTQTVTFNVVFPPRSLGAWQREIAEPLGIHTAVLLEMSGWPMAPSALRSFLSPFFFKDRSPTLVLLVRDWMGFSTELESHRQGSGGPPQLPPRDSILGQLPPRRRR